MTGPNEEITTSTKFVALPEELVGVERQTAVHLRNQGRIGDELLRELEHELDLGELRLRGGDEDKYGRNKESRTWGSGVWMENYPAGKTLAFRCTKARLVCDERTSS